MRTLRRFASTLLVLMGALLSSAQATPTVSLIWTSSVIGATGLGTSHVLACCGDTLTLEVRIRVGPEGLKGFATTYTWTPGALTHQLSVLSGAVAWQVTGNGAVNNGAGSAVGQLAGSIVFGDGPASTTFVQGSLTFATHPFFSGQFTVTTGVFTGFDGVIGNDNQPYPSPVFNSATIDLFGVPEIGALPALGLGLAALAARRRRVTRVRSD